MDQCKRNAAGCRLQRSSEPVYAGSGRDHLLAVTSHREVLKDFLADRGFDKIARLTTKGLK